MWRKTSLPYLFVSLRLTALGNCLLGLNNTLVTKPSFGVTKSFSPLQDQVRPETNRDLISGCFRSLSDLVRLLFIRNGQFQTTLGSSSLEHQTTTLGGHTGAEAKLAVSLDFAWLIRALHVYFSSAWLYLNESGLRVYGAGLGGVNHGQRLNSSRQSGHKSFPGHQLKNR